MICNNCKNILSKISIANESDCNNPDCIIYFKASTCMRTTSFPGINTFIQNVYKTNSNDFDEIEIISTKYLFKWDSIYYIYSNKKDFQNTINDFIKKYEYFYLLG